MISPTGFNKTRSLLAPAFWGEGRRSFTGEPGIFSPRFFTPLAFLICLFSVRSGIAQSSAGVPLGGLGAGSVRLEADGRFRGASLPGAAPAPGELPGCFAALWTRIPSRSTAEVLTSSPLLGLPLSANTPVFTARFPFAFLFYPDAARPVSVTLSAFSPLIPQDVHNSSFPGFLLSFNLKNETNEPVEVSAALSFEPMPEKEAQSAQVRFVPVAASEGNFGGYLGAAGKSETVLQVQPSHGEALVTQTGWTLSDRLPDWWSRFSEEGRVTSAGDPAQQRPGSLAAVLAVRLVLKPRERLEIPFAVSWNHFPAETLDAGKTPRPTEPFGDPLKTARELLDGRLALTALTEEWQGKITTSNLPGWLQTLLINCLSPIPSALVRSKTSPPRFIEASGQTAAAVSACPALLVLDTLFPALLSSSPTPGSYPRSEAAEALRLLQAGRPEEALTLLERSEKKQRPPVLTDTALWQTLSALWGFQLNTEELTLEPRLPGTWRSLRAPLFAPGFWAYGEYVPRVRGYSLSFRLDRTFALPVEEGKPSSRPSAPNLVLRSMVVPSPPPLPGSSGSPTLFARLRQSALGVQVTSLSNGLLRITFDTPVHLAVGDRIDLEVKSASLP